MQRMKITNDGFGANNDPDKLRFHLDPEFIVCCSEVFANDHVKKIVSDGAEFKT